MTCGSGLNRFCRERQRTLDGRRIIGCFLKPCCGASARDCRGGIFPRILVTGTVSSGAFAGGCRRDFRVVFSACYPTISICRSYRSTARSCRRMPRLRDPKKELIRRHRTFKRRSDEQDRRADGRDWEVDPLDHPPRPESRSGGDARPSSRHCFHDIDRRQGL